MSIGFLLGIDKNFVKLDCGDGRTTLWIYKKSIELYTLNGQIYGIWILPQFNTVPYWKINIKKAVLKNSWGS